MTELSIEQRAAQIAAKIAAPLSESERNVAKLMGLSEHEFLEQRNAELRVQLPGWHAGMEHGLTKEEAHVATIMNIPFADYAATKISDAEQRRQRMGG